MYTMSTIKEHEILLSGFRGVALTIPFSSICNLAKFLSSKVESFPEKIESTFLQIRDSTQYVLHSNNVSRNSVERFQMSSDELR